MKSGSKALVPGCNACGCDNLDPVIQMDAIPVHCGIYYANRAEARQAPRATLDLHVCSHCGHIQNKRFNPALLRYGTEYENAQTCSPHFRRYLDSLAKRLVRVYALRGKEIVEIGCGQGEFLRLLCRLGGNRGTGIDPGYRPTQDAKSKSVRFIQERFNPSREYFRTAGLVGFRHLLEHFEHPSEFLCSLRASLQCAGTVVYCEVPNAESMVVGLGIWDFIYEHCSYFTRTSLRRAFTRAGFRVLSLRSAFGGQFLCCEAVPDKIERKRKRDSAFPLGLEKYATRAGQHLLGVRQRLEKWKRHGERIGIWGAGSKGVMLANYMRWGAVEGLIDINPHKQGKYIACTGHPVWAPSDLRSIKLDRILMTNSAYKKEVSKYLAKAGISSVLEQI